MFDEFLVPRGLPPFTRRRLPRLRRRRAALRRRAHVPRARAASTLPEGDPSDPPGDGLGGRARQPQERRCSSEVLRDDGIAPYPGSLRLPRPPRRSGHEDGRRVVVAQRPRGARRVRAWRRGSRSSPTASSPPSEHIAGKPAPDMFLERRRAARRRRRPTPSSSRTPCPASRPGGPATSASSSASTAAPATTRCASTAPTSSSTTSRELVDGGREAPGPRAPRAAPLPDRPVAARRARVRRRATSA